MLCLEGMQEQWSAIVTNQPGKTVCQQQLETAACYKITFTGKKQSKLNGEEFKMKKRDWQK